MSAVYLDRDAVLQRASGLDVVRAVTDALTDAAQGAAGQAVRTELVPPGMGGLLGYMPAYRERSPRLMSAKVVSVFPGNPARGLPTHHGLAVLFNGETGEPLGIAEAGAVTELRTAAMSCVATRLLSRPDRRRHLVVGTGHQASSHLRALAHYDPDVALLLWGRDPAAAARLAHHVRDFGVQVEVLADLDNATRAADVITTLTSARRPILEAGGVRPGTHINAMGSSAPAVCEIGGDLMADATLFVDHREAALSLAGEFVRLEHPQEVREIGDVLAGRTVGRTGPAEITLFKSVGVGLLDLALLQALFVPEGSA